MKESLKKQAVEYKGNGCLICGESDCLASLDFHHIDPQDKIKNISTYSSWSEDLVTELDKCALLCKNCHAKIHNGLISHDIFDVLEL